MDKIVIEKSKKIVMRFDGFSDLGDFARGTPGGSSDKPFNRKFHRSTSSLNEAIHQTVSGWEGAFGRIEEIREAVRERLGYIDTKVWRFENSPNGQYLDWDTYLSGDPNCTLMALEDTVRRPTKFIRILVDVAYSWMVKPADIETRGGAVIALCDALNTCGYTTEVWATCTLSGSALGSELAIITPVQLCNTPWDVRSASFPLANADHLRRNVFAVMERLDDDERRQFGVGGGYGTPKVSQKGGLADQYCGGADVICRNSSGCIDEITRDPIKWVITQCKNLGVITQEESV